MKKSSSFGQIGHKIAALVHRYHIMIFVLTVVIGVSVAVFMLNDIIISSNQSEEAPPQRTAFDKATIDAIDKFSEANETKKEFILPSGRTNPFVE